MANLLLVDSNKLFASSPEFVFGHGCHLKSKGYRIVADGLAG